MCNWRKQKPYNTEITKIYNYDNKQLVLYISCIVYDHNYLHVYNNNYTSLVKHGDNTNVHIIIIPT